MTRADREARATWLAAERAAYLDAIATTPPDLLGPCHHCRGLGEVPHEDDARECPACYGCGQQVEDDATPPHTDADAPDAEPDAPAVEAWRQHVMGLRARESAWGVWEARR